MIYKPVEFAMEYAKRGWLVIPLHTPNENFCSCGSHCQSIGKHPRIKGGVHSATTDLEVIQGWWKSWPLANVGIVTGSVSNLVVIDIDERHGGLGSWKKWENENYVKTKLKVRTGGGFHLYFHACDLKLKSRTGILPGVDVRGEGGYVVAPGSLHYSKTIYSWIGDQNNQPSPLPESLIQLLSNSAKKDSDFKNKSEISTGRNNFLTKIAGLLRNEAFDSQNIFQGLQAINQVLCSPALDENEVSNIAKSVSKYETKWGEIINPFEKRFVAPQLDTAVLPTVLESWVNDASERMQVPPKFFAAPCLVSLASVIGRQVGIFSKQADNWYVIPNLWGAIVARPGLFNSPAIIEATSFLRRQAEMFSQKYDQDCLVSAVVHF